MKSMKKGLIGLVLTIALACCQTKICKGSGPLEKLSGSVASVTQKDIESEEARELLVSVGNRHHPPRTVRYGYPRYYHYDSSQNRWYTYSRYQYYGHYYPNIPRQGIRYNQYKYYWPREGYYYRGHYYPRYQRYHFYYHQPLGSGTHIIFSF